MAASHFGENFGQGPSTLAIPPAPLLDEHDDRVLSVSEWNRLLSPWAN